MRHMSFAQPNGIRRPSRSAIALLTSGICETIATGSPRNSSCRPRRRCKDRERAGTSCSSRHRSGHESAAPCPAATSPRTWRRARENSIARPAMRRQKIDRFRKSRRFDVAAVVRRRTIGAHDMRLVETFDEDAGLVIDHEAERSLHAAHALGPQILSGTIEQCREKLAVVYALQEAEMPRRVVVFREMRVVDHAGDASDRHAIARGDERADVILLHERRFLLVEGPMHLVP